MRAEYDFSKLKTVRGKYAARFARGTNLVLIDPELAKAFPTDEAVNETLRDALKMATRIATAAQATGIGLTLLPVFYAHSNFGGKAPNHGQRRFIHNLDSFARLLEA